MDEITGSGRARGHGGSSQSRGHVWRAICASKREDWSFYDDGLTVYGKAGGIRIQLAVRCRREKTLDLMHQVLSFEELFADFLVQFSRSDQRSNRRTISESHDFRVRWCVAGLQQGDQGLQMVQTTSALSHVPCSQSGLGLKSFH